MSRYGFFFLILVAVVVLTEFQRQTDALSELGLIVTDATGNSQILVLGVAGAAVGPQEGVVVTRVRLVRG